MRPIQEMLDHIQSLAATSQHKEVFRICYELGLHVQQLQGISKAITLTDNTDALISETDAIIDRERARSAMVLLNRLKAAPGQPCRDVVKHFLKVKGWINDNQEPEDWPVKHLPTPNQVVPLMKEIDEFSQRQAESCKQP